MNPYIGIVVAVIGLLVSVYSVVTSKQNTSKADIKELEHRLTLVESTGVGVKEIESRLTKLETKESGQSGSLASIATAVASMDRQVTALETKVEVFWRGMVTDAAALLHHPHPEFARRDYLIEQLTFNKLTQAEAEELYDMLLPVWNDTEVAYGVRLASSIVMRALSVDFNIDKQK